MTSQPTQEQVDDLLLACRYGDIEDVQAFINEFGAKAVEDARDERGNTVLHMCCGNGHAGEQPPEESNAMLLF
jgi:ankyrin repeat protein